MDPGLSLNSVASASEPSSTVPAGLDPESGKAVSSPTAATNLQSSSASRQMESALHAPVVDTSLDVLPFPTNTSAFFELCVRRNSRLTRLGEITLTDEQHCPKVRSDKELFSK